jgi:hypothetical protein
MSIGCGLKKIAAGFHNQSRHFSVGRKCCTALRSGRRGSTRIPLNYQVMGWGRCRLRWSTWLSSCHTVEYEPYNPPPSRCQR